MRDSGLTRLSLSLPLLTVNHAVSGGVGADLSQLPTLAYWTSFFRMRAQVVFGVCLVGLRVYPCDDFFDVVSCGGFWVVGAAFNEGASVISVLRHSASRKPKRFQGNTKFSSSSAFSSWASLRFALSYCLA